MCGLWRREDPSEPGGPELDRSELDVLADAVSRAPSVHDTHPWRLETHAHGATLLECPPYDPVDPLRTDREISCGAALANLKLAVRQLGRAATVETDPGDAAPDETVVPQGAAAQKLVARITAGAPQPPTDEESRLFGAIERRRSHRHRFGQQPVPQAIVSEIAGATEQGGVATHRVAGSQDAAALAELLAQATLQLRGDRIYQRELLGWSGANGEPGTGLPEHESLPAAGLVRHDTPVPDRDVLAGRIAAETLVVLGTPGDSRAEHIAAGVALQRGWLAATAAGLVASVITQAIHRAGLRGRLAERLGLAGTPQAILRFGYPP